MVIRRADGTSSFAEDLASLIFAGSTKSDLPPVWEFEKFPLYFSERIDPVWECNPLKSNEMYEPGVVRLGNFTIEIIALFQKFPNLADEVRELFRHFQGSSLSSG